MDKNEVNDQEQSSDDEKEEIKVTEVSDNISKNTSEDTTIKQEESTVAKQTTTVQEPTYPIQEFINNSKALGYSKEVVAGALFNCKKSELTKTEFEAIIKNFLGKKVK